MRQWILKAGASGPDALELRDVAVPEPGPGQVRVRVRAASLNRRDQFVLSDPNYRAACRDLVPVSDGAGEVDALGEGVEAWSVGDRVVSLYFRGWVNGPPHADMGEGLGSLDEDGMLAEHVILPASRIARAPASLDHGQAATLPCAALTAWNALHGDHPVGRGSTVIVLGSGGVSLFSLLLARAAGARVLATTSREDRRHQLSALGASDDVLDYRTTPQWGHAVFERTGGVDRVVDALGWGELGQSLAALRPGGEVAVMGLFSSAGDPPDPALLLGRALVVRGIAVGNAQDYAAMSAFIDAHQVQPPIARIFAFDDAREAYAAQESGELFGKVVITLP